MNTIFIAGTDTSVGKTWVTGLFGRYLVEHGYRVVTQKWIQTGRKFFPQDIDMHLRLMKKEKGEFRRYLSSMSPYLFDIASSPHLAAHLEKKNIRIDKIKRCKDALSEDFDFLIIEGTGGLLVPLSGERLLIDVVKVLSLPVLLVAGNRLGAINQALLSLEALRTRKIKVLGIIFNNISNKENGLILKDNPNITKRFSGTEVLGILPYVDKAELLHKRFILIGNKIQDRLWRIG